MLKIKQIKQNRNTKRKINWPLSFENSSKKGKSNIWINEISLLLIEVLYSSSLLFITYSIIGKLLIKQIEEKIPPHINAKIIFFLNLDLSKIKGNARIAEIWASIECGKLAEVEIKQK